MENPIPTRAFDELVAEELEALSAILTASGKSVTITVVAASGMIAETYTRIAVKPSDRLGILQGLSSEVLGLEDRWRAGN